jgi:hypothetical protein
MRLKCGCIVVGGEISDPCDGHNRGRIQDTINEVSDTLRDEFAKAALPACIARMSDSTSPTNVVRLAYAFADLMLEIRNGK